MWKFIVACLALTTVSAQPTYPWIVNGRSCECTCTSGNTPTAPIVLPGKGSIPRNSPTVAPLPSPVKPSAQPPASAPAQATNNGVKAVLDVINAQRAKHHAPALQWSDTVAAYAQNWVNNCKFAHSQGSGYGENIYMSSANLDAKTAVTNAAQAWYDEVALYNFANPGFSVQTGHFSANCWKSSQRLGCAVKYCPNLGTFVSCNFDPAGNIIGQFRENVIEP